MRSEAVVSKMYPPGRSAFGVFVRKEVSVKRDIRTDAGKTLHPRVMARVIPISSNMEKPRCFSGEDVEELGSLQGRLLLDNHRVKPHLIESCFDPARPSSMSCTSTTTCLTLAQSSSPIPMRQSYSAPSQSILIVNLVNLVFRDEIRDSFQLAFECLGAMPHPKREPLCDESG